MDNPYETSVVAKALWSAVVVLGVIAIAERVSTRVAGIVSGAPLSAVLIYFFVGQDMGVHYVVASVPHGIAAFSATLLFVLAYYAASSVLSRHVPLGAAVVATLVFMLAGVGLVAIPFTLLTATATTGCVLVCAIWAFRKIEFLPVAKPVRYTPTLLLVRGSFSSFLIVCVIALAESLGSRWTGLLAGFPSTLLPALVIIHVTYGRANTHAVIRNFPVGMASIVLFIVSVGFFFPRIGVTLGTVASLAVSVAYLTAVMLWIRARPIADSC